MDKQLTVLQILPALNSGGVERGTLELANYLVAQGHQSIVISAGGLMLPELLATGSTHIYMPIGKKSPFTFLLIFKLRKILKQYNIDILHVRSRLPAWVAYLAWRGMAKQIRPKFITTVHGLNSINKYSKIMTYGEKVIAVSEAVKQYIINAYPDINEHKIKVIHRGVDEKQFPYHYQPSSQWKHEFFGQFPQLENKDIILLPGRISRLKGHSDFIDVIAKIKKDNKNIHGLIMGYCDPRHQDYLDELKNKINMLNLSEDITLISHREDVKEVFSSCRVVLSLSSKPESFGRTVLEALALGVPVVAYAHGGVAEILSNLFPFGAVEVGDIEKVCIKIKTIISESTSVHKKNQYRLHDMLANTLKLYHEAIKR